MPGEVMEHAKCTKCGVERPVLFLKDGICALNTAVISLCRDAVVSQLAEAKLEELPWEDVKDEWSDAIKAAFPTRSGSHDEYGRAMKMISNRHSKGELVALVNWLLVEVKTYKPAYEREQQANEVLRACGFDVDGLRAEAAKRRGVDFPCEDCGATAGSGFDNGWWRCSACGYPGK